MTTPLMDAVIRPRRTWRRLGAGAKLAVYTRISMQIVVVSLGILGIVLPLVDPSPRMDLDPWQQTLVITVTVIMIMAGLVILEFRPEFNTALRRTTHRLVPVTAVFGGVIWATGLLSYTVGTGSTALTGIMLALVSCMLTPLVALPWLPWHWTTTIVLSTLTAVVMWQEVQWWPMFFATFALSTATASAWTVNLAKELDRARLTESALQVSEERLRFAQELHDTLGQRLAAVSVKAELARALAKRGDDRLDGELAELQELVRASTTEMREVIEGYRTVNLSTELQGARHLLENAGIRLEVHGDPTAPSPEVRELAAWLVREGITNVVRHSAATWVTLEFGRGSNPDIVTMTNDGVVRGIEKLSGLAGIRHRAEPIGATLVAEADGNLFRVTLSCPVVNS